MHLEIRSFGEQDFGFALTQTAREQWDSTVEAFEVCLAHDPDGCFLAESSGQSVGMVTTIRYLRGAWVGNLIVVPEFRRKGVGHRLMSHAIEHLEALGTKTMRLEADPMGIGLYRRLGFTEQFESPRFRREPPHEVDRGAADRLVADHVSVLQAFDQGCFGDDRGRLLALLFGKARATYGVWQQERLSGYLMMLPSASGVRLGPWCAADREVADELLRTVLADFREIPIIAGVPAVNRAAVELVTAYGFDPMPASLRMTRGGRAAESDPVRLYAIANGAMG